MSTFQTRSRWRPATALVSLALALSLLAAGCEADTGSDEQADVDAVEADEGDAQSASGILIDETATRFSEIDWLVLDVERRPDGPGDDGEDTDPSEDFVYAEIDLSSDVSDVTFQLPYEWVVLVNTDGAAVRPTAAYERGSGDRVSTYVDVEPARTTELQIVYTVDAGEAYDGGWFAVDSGPEYLSAAMAGPQRMEEDARLDASFETTVYSGAFSRDEARVEILNGYWSREIGQQDDGTLIGSPDNSSRRPRADGVWLLVHFEVTCELTGINTGGCNVTGGQVDVDGARSDGSLINSGANYGETEDFWAAYPVPTDAQAVSVHISDLRTDAETDFVVSDLSPLLELETPDL